jgi:hypothetical protein
MWVADTDQRIWMLHRSPAFLMADPKRPLWLLMWANGSLLSAPTEVLVAADTPQEVLGWLAQRNRRADYGMFRVPAEARDAEGAAPL